MMRRICDGERDVYARGSVPAARHIHVFTDGFDKGRDYTLCPSRTEASL